MTPILLECGHTANAVCDGHPACAICFPLTEASTVAVDAPNLEGRLARCGCGKTLPSNLNLAFFEYCGPGSRRANDICKNCQYALAAHDPVAMSQNVPSNRRTVVEQGKCSGFEPHGAFKFDGFYCGCRGWD